MTEILPLIRVPANGAALPLDWARDIGIPLPCNPKGNWLIQSHPGLLDIFTGMVRKQQSQDFLTKECCVVPSDGNFEGRLMVLDIGQVRDRYPAADRQMFYCAEDTGDVVLGVFLKDNSIGCFQHSDFLGELKPEFVPAWVPDALEDMGCSPGQIQDMGMKMDF